MIFWVNKCVDILKKNECALATSSIYLYWYCFNAITEKLAFLESGLHGPILYLPVNGSLHCGSLPLKLIYCSCLIRITYVNKYCFVLESKISTCNSAKLSTCAYIYKISRESERGKNKQKFIEAVAFMKINCTSFEVFHMGFILCIYAKPKALDKPMQIQFMCHIHTLLCYNWRFVNFWLEIFYRCIWWCFYCLLMFSFCLF